ncbi:MAG: hypothetical protein WKF68_12145 [Daejeonella sp.]
MKKNKLKTLVKSARKTALKDIKASLITQLSEISARLGQDPEKLSKTIGKGSKKLAKKLIKEFKIKKGVLKAAEKLDLPTLSVVETPLAVKSSTTTAQPVRTRSRSKAAPASTSVNTSVRKKPATRTTVKRDIVSSEQK